jgi:hypothetical protein
VFFFFFETKQHKMKEQKKISSSQESHKDASQAWHVGCTEQLGEQLLMGVEI